MRTPNDRVYVVLHCDRLASSMLLYCSVYVQIVLLQLYLTHL
jgi:hypothetical protein